MMDTLTNIPRRTALYGAMLATAALVITLLAVTFAAGPAQAQSKTYPAPQPCGQGHAKVPEKPVDQITSGEIVLFDAYWDINTRTINNNLCPPKMVEHTEKKGRETVTVTARGDANIDIAKTVVHVTDDHKVTVVEGTAGPGQISLAEYPFIKDGLDLNSDGTLKPGTEVYWLQLDDPDTPADETSDLVLGFSTALFDGQYWEPRDGDKPLQYEFESERDDIYEVHGPHFFAFAAPKANNGVQEDAIWNSADGDENQIQMDAGEKFHRVQWVFTEPGSHHIQAHVKGHVRQNPPANAGSGWQRIHPEEKTSTSEVRLYTIQSGPLNFNDQPMFQVERSVAENSAAGVKVGAPVPVANGDDGDTLAYGLTGKGSSLFDVAGAPGGGAQVTVAAGALLDYETKSTYDLVLGVSDGKDHEGSPDPSIDSAVALKITLTDVTGAPKVAIQVDDPAPATGETVTLTSSLSGDIPPPALIRYVWVEHDVKNKVNTDLNVNNEQGTDSVSVARSTEGERTYQAHLSWPGYAHGELGSNILSVTWADKP